MRYLWVLFLFLLPNQAFSEHICHTLLSYKWHKSEGKSDPKEAQSVEFETVEALGLDEKTAKTNLQEVILKGKARALQHCRQQHENVADCIAAKYSGKASLINTMRFEARKTLEQAIQSDCAAAQGICAAVEAAEVKCEEKISSSETPGAGAEGGKGEKEKGKKK